MFTRKLVITTEWIKLSDTSDNMSISFRAFLRFGESTVVPDDNTPLLRLENDMAPIAVDALSWVRVPVERHENVIVYIF